jgi:hypothetical protein
MTGFRTFETGRVSFGDNRPKAPLVDIALVRGAHLKAAAQPKSPIKAPAPKPRAEPKIGEKGFIPPKPVRPEDFEDQKAFPMKRLTAIVSAVTGVSVLEICSHRRLAQQVKARQILFWVSKNYTLLSLPQISYRVGKRDHSTALFGIRKVQKIFDRLNVAKPTCPIAAAELLWAADWAEVSQ